MTLMRGCACRGTAGYAHLSCLLEAAAKEVEFNAENGDPEDIVSATDELWQTCKLCNQPRTGCLEMMLALNRWETAKCLAHTCDEHRNARHQLASAYIADNENEKAIELIEPALNYDREAINTSSDVPAYMVENVISEATNLGMCLARIGRFDEAMAHYTQALELADQVPVPGKDLLLARATVMNNIAQVHMNAKHDPFAAIPILEEVQQIRQDLTGKDSFEFLISVFATACAYAAAQRTDDAYHLINDNLPRARRLFGQDHPQTMRFESLHKSLTSKFSNRRINALLKGLSNKPELNGTKVVVTRYRADKEKYEVINSASNKFLAKPDNLLLDDGTKVRIQGLVSASQHNGKCGIVHTFDSEKGRYIVNLMNEAASKLLVKPTNCIAF
jgi:tetratricopeptide (TPR) repeat protein